LGSWFSLATAVPTNEVFSCFIVSLVYGITVSCAMTGVMGVVGLVYPLGF